MSLGHTTSVIDAWHLSGSNISESFRAGTCCENTVVSFYTRCLIADETKHGSDSVGYRIFLDPKISVSEKFVCSYNVFLSSLIFFVAYRNICWLT